MAVLEILTAPDPRLRVQSKQVTELTLKDINEPSFC